MSSEGGELVVNERNGTTDDYDGEDLEESKQAERGEDHIDREEERTETEEEEDNI